MSIFRNANKLLYNSRIMGVGANSHLQRLNRSSPLLLNTAKRSHSLFWQRMGIDYARVKITLFPLSRLESGGRYFLWVAFEWWFVGVFVWCLIPWWFHMQYIGHWVRSWEYHTLELKEDTYRDPLIPPPDVWNNQNKHFIEEIKIRNARMEEQRQRLEG